MLRSYRQWFVGVYPSMALFKLCKRSSASGKALLYSNFCPFSSSSISKIKVLGR